MDNMSAVIATYQPDSGDNDDVPHCSIAFWVGDTHDDVDIVLHTLHEPTDRPASEALLYGLGVMALSRSNQLERVIEDMFPHGRPSEKQAVQYLKTLSQDEDDGRPI